MTLGICATTQGCLPYLKGIVGAATHAGKQVEIFVTGEAVHLPQDPGFAELLAMAKVTAKSATSPRASRAWKFGVSMTRTSLRKRKTPNSLSAATATFCYRRLSHGEKGHRRHKE